MIVVVEMIAGRRHLSCGKALESGSIHQKNVGPTVVVVIENCDAGSGGLDDVFLCLPPAEDIGQGQARLFRDIGEVGDGGSIPGVGGGSRKSENDEKRSQSAGSNECTRPLRKTQIHDCLNTRVRT